MATVQVILAQKQGGMLTATPDTTVLEAARMMNERGTGSILVMTDGRLVGIFTERDVMRRVVALSKDPTTTRLKEVMTTALVTCNHDAPLSDCGALMSERRIRHLPVVDGAEVRGVITTGDLLAHELGEKESTIQHLESFVFNTR